MKHATTVLVSFSLLVATGCGASVQEPESAAGVGGPAVLDEAGIVADWEIIGGPDEKLPRPYHPGSYDDDFGIVSAAPESTEIVVVWSGLPCQLEPVAQVTSLNGSIHIKVTPGPNPVEHCAAIAIGYGFVLTLTEPLGDRVVTAKLIDPVNQRLIRSTVPTTTTAGTTSTTSTIARPATASTEPPSGTAVLVAFSFASEECEGEVAVVDRVIADGDDPLVSAFELLVAGPTLDEKTDGFSSWFSAKTAGTVRSVELQDGLLIVDFDNFTETIGNASTSCGSVSLLAELNGTAFQLADVDAATYEIEGSCETFFHWLQRGCMIYPRP